MRNLLALVMLFISTSLIADVSSHGDNMPTGESATLTAAIEAGSTSDPQKIRGEITEVCQKKGCFMVLTDGQNFARVTFKDYGFFVPKDSAPRKAVVYGELTSKTLSADQANHYEADAGREGRHTEAVTEYAIVASSVVIL